MSYNYIDLTSLYKYNNIYTEITTSYYYESLVTIRPQSNRVEKFYENLQNTKKEDVILLLVHHMIIQMNMATQ